jgi:SAM-dependent methyltransferase
MASAVRCSVCRADLELSGAHTFQFTTARGLSTWARCNACRSYFDAARYDRDLEVSHTRTCSWGKLKTGTELNLFKHRMYLSVIQLLSRHTSKGSSILDVGCSFGGFLEQARIHGFDGQGMDIVPEAVDYVRQLGIPCRVAASIGELDLPDASMDIISVLDSNYYWPEHRTELCACWRKLRSSGLLILRLVDKSWMLTSALATRKMFPKLSAHLCEKAVNDHRVSVPLSSMLCLLRKERFEIVYASPRGALHSDQSSAAVKVSFAVGYVVWHLTGFNIAPGALVLARKPET